MEQSEPLLALADPDFPISIVEHRKMRQGQVFDLHAHEHLLQLFCFSKGEAVIYVSQRPARMGPGDILLVNCGEPHYGESLADALCYTVYRVDLPLLLSYGIPACSEKYLRPLRDHLLLLEHTPDSAAVRSILTQMSDIFAEKREGYELALMGCTYALLAALVHNHRERSISHREAEVLAKRRGRFQNVIAYIETHYESPIPLETAARIAHMSEGYFCRLFKKTTGRTLTDYCNRCRIERAVILLDQGTCNVTEAALSVGFDDINYFCRVFKKHMRQSPTQYLTNNRKHFI